MSETRKRDRIFAGLGAALFLGSACALTFAVIWQATHSNAANTTAQTTPTATCTDTSTYGTLPPPEIYKAPGKVTSLTRTNLQAGTGATAKAGDCLVVKYYGTLASSGVRFDDNFSSSTGFAFKLGAGQVIPGWDQGLVGMKVGSTSRLVIPASLGYGSQANGSIPANSDLVFVVKLLKIKD